jgi:2Fe-2S ferredoxin
MTTPKKPYKLTFKPNNVVVNVEPAKVPYSETGLPGSVLEIALGNGVDIEHVCGGNIACSTCHIIVKQGLETCTPISPEEEEQLAVATGRTPQSRLSCQCVASGEKDLLVEIP